MEQQMATENEEILKAHIEDLQTSMMQMTGYLHELVQIVNQNQNMSDSYSHQFYSQDQVDVYLPFYVSPTSLVSVMVEETPGQYRQVTPIININSQNVTVKFDRQQSGFVIIYNDVGCAMNIDPPPNLVSMGSVSLYEPALEPPFVDPIDVYQLQLKCMQPMTAKSPVGSEDVSADPSFINKGEKAFTKAMGDIKPWP